MLSEIECPECRPTTLQKTFPQKIIRRLCFSKDKDEQEKVYKFKQLK